MPTLTIQLPGFPPVEHLLRDEMMTIGRMKGNTIALDDASVSVSHAKITRKGGEFFVKDLNSTNGTMLNGQSINEARLKDGDQIKFGEVIACFRGEPAIVSPVPSQNSPPSASSAAPTAAVSASAPVSVSSAPSPVGIGTTFVSRRLVTQASQLSQNPPPLSSSAQTTQLSRSRKKKSAWLFPVLAGAVALGAVVILGMKFLRPESPRPSLDPGAAVIAPPASNPGPKAPAPGAAGKPSTPSKTSGAPNGSRSLAELKAALKAADPAERRRAAAALHALGAGAKDALPDLRNALKDTDADVRMWAALALINNKSYDKAAIPVLVQVLRNDNSMLRQVSCLSLALIPYEDAERETVVAALADTANKDEDEEVRKSALSALKIIAPEVIGNGK